MTTAFPLRVSNNHRFLEDQNGTPFLVHADTAWRALIELSPDETRFYLDDRIARGFNALQVHAVNMEGRGTLNRNGDAPFHDGDLSRPNAPYWDYAEQMLDEMGARGFFIALSACWFGYLGHDYKPLLTESNAAIYGQFLAKRFGRFSNVMWYLGGDCDPGDKIEATRVLARTLREGAPHHLLSFHAADGNSSALWFQDDAWLDVNMAYTYHAMDPHVGPEWKREPPRPIVLGETGYQGESNKGFLTTPALVRRQPWGALLSGACGHAQGCEGVYSFKPNWREALDFEATRDMTHLRVLFESLAWQTLEPDLEHQLLTRGWASFQDADNAVAARARDGSFALIYTPTSRVLTLDLSRLEGTTRARWFDPTSGEFQNTAPGEKMQTPGKNARGDEDWVLLLQTSKAA